MSIYSGFATRAQEQSYDQCIDSLLYLLQKRIIKFYKNQQADEDRFITLVVKIHHQLKNMEQSKYLEPKTSNSLNQLVKIMNVHQKNGSGEKYRNHEGEYGSTYEPLPAVENRHNQENSGKRKESLWVEKVPSKRDKMVDQEIQTMGTLYDKKDSPKPTNGSKNTNQRNIISSFKTKYGQKMSTVKRHNNEFPPTQGHNLKNRSHSHHLANNQTFYYDYQVKNHLKQVQTINRRKRRNKLNTKLGLRDLPTQEQSQFQVGDIIKDYVTRIKRKVELPENIKSGKDNRLSDF